MSRVRPLTHAEHPTRPTPTVPWCPSGIRSWADHPGKFGNIKKSRNPEPGRVLRDGLRRRQSEKNVRLMEFTGGGSLRATSHLHPTPCGKGLGWGSWDEVGSSAPPAARHQPTVRFVRADCRSIDRREPMTHLMPFTKVILEILRHRLFDEHRMRYNENRSKRPWPR